MPSANHLTFNTDNPAHQKASRLKADAANQLAAIDRDPNLSTQGKNTARQEIRDNVNRQLVAMAADDETARTARIDTLRRRALTPTFPLGASVADRIAITNAHSAALARAETIDNPADLTAMLKRADMTGNRIEMKAAAAVALERGDTDTLNVYLAGAPAAEQADINELWDSTQHATVDRVSAAFVYGHI